MESKQLDRGVLDEFEASGSRCRDGGASDVCLSDNAVLDMCIQ